MRQLKEHSCPNCEYPIEKNFLRCPNCQRRLKDPCPSCGKPVDPRWGLCPFCETDARERRPSASGGPRTASAARGDRRRADEPERREAREQRPPPKGAPASAREESSA